MTTTVLAYIPSPAQGVWHISIPFLDLSIPIRAYAMCIIVGIIVALVISDRRWQQRGGEAGVIYDIALWAVPFGLIGGRLYHVLTDWPTYFGADGAGFIAALRIWDGGLGIWGAVALGGVGAWIACRRRGVPLPAFGDAVAPGIVLAQAIGRLGNYFNQELYGRETTVPWGLEIFNRRDPSGLISVHSLDGVSVGPPALMVVHPTFLYELLWNVFVFVVLILVDRRFKIGHGRLFALYVAAYCVGRFGVELLRSDPATLIAGIRINSFTSTLVFIGAVVYMMVAPRGREDPDTLLGKPSDHSDGERVLAKEMVSVAATSGVVVAATVAGREDDAGESTSSSSGAQSEDLHEDLVADILSGAEVQSTDEVDEGDADEPAAAEDQVDLEPAPADADLVVPDAADVEPAPVEDEVVANVEDTAAVADDEALTEAEVEPAPADGDVVVGDVADVEPALAEDEIVSEVEPVADPEAESPQVGVVADEPPVEDAVVADDVVAEPVLTDDVANVEDTAGVADDEALAQPAPEPADGDVVVGDVADVEPALAEDEIVSEVEPVADPEAESPQVGVVADEPSVEGVVVAEDVVAEPVLTDDVANVEDTAAVADDEALAEPADEDVVVGDVADVEPALAADVVAEPVLTDDVANVEDTAAVADDEALAEPAPEPADQDVVLADDVVAEAAPTEDETVPNVEDTAAVADQADDVGAETPDAATTADKPSPYTVVVTPTEPAPGRLRRLLGRRGR